MPVSLFWWHGRWFICVLCNQARGHKGLAIHPIFHILSLKQTSRRAINIKTRHTAQFIWYATLLFEDETGGFMWFMRRSRFFYFFLLLDYITDAAAVSHLQNPELRSLGCFCSKRCLFILSVCETRSFDSSFVLGIRAIVASSLCVCASYGPVCCCYSMLNSHSGLCPPYCKRRMEMRAISQHREFQNKHNVLFSYKIKTDACYRSTQNKHWIQCVYICLY